MFKKTTSSVGKLLPEKENGKEENKIGGHILMTELSFEFLGKERHDPKHVWLNMRWSKQERCQGIVVEASSWPPNNLLSEDLSNLSMMLVNEMK
ncbi:hypothetical protein VNO78_13334 [Psophocarpus tetragonolobus]|uniref:Uncharacterized protein n=1 Tax=Psophocarpus tetragonolobus TaxID=3891 RepID=A0AAN9SRV2_PSOTE